MVRPQRMQLSRRGGYNLQDASHALNGLPARRITRPGPWGNPFTIIGCNVALEMGQQPIIVIVSGLITGIVGGVLRDVLCNDVPLVFSSELYATVAIVAGTLYYFGHTMGLPHDMVVIGTIAVGFTLRVLAIVFKLEMPKFVYDKELR